MKKLITTALCAGLCSTSSAALADDRITIGGLLGAHIFSDNLELGAFDSDDADSPRNSVAFGMRAGYEDGR